MPTPRKSDRNAQIVALAAAGVPYPEIASMYRLSVSRVSFIARTYGDVQRGCGWKGYMWYHLDRRRRRLR